MDSVLTFINANIPLSVLIGLTILDILSGIVAAAINGQLSGSIAFQGALKKTIQFFVVGVAYLFESYDRSVPLSGLTIGFYILAEVTSILENAQKAGITIPGEILAVSNTFGTLSATPTFITPQPVQPGVFVPTIQTPGMLPGTTTITASNGSGTTFSSLSFDGSGMAVTKVDPAAQILHGATDQRGAMTIGDDPTIKLPPLADPIDVANADPTHGVGSVL